MTHLAFAWQGNDPELHSSISVLTKKNIIIMVYLIFKINFKLTMTKIKDMSWLDSCPISLMFLNRLLVSLNFIQFLSQSYESEMAFILNFKPRQNGVIRFRAVSFLKVKKKECLFLSVTRRDDI